MNRKDIVIGLVILAVIAGIIYFVRKPQKPQIVLPQPSVEENIEERFNTQIPDNVEKTELKDVNGGTGSGIATRLFENNLFESSVLVDLPEPEGNMFYAGWLVKDDTYLSLGKLRIAKGGFVLDYSTGKDYSDYNKVMVSLESVLGKKPSKVVLEGSF